MHDFTQTPTLLHLFAARLAADADAPALLWHDGAQYQTDTWTTLAADAERLAGGLARQGIVAGDMVAQLSENRREWILADLAIQAVGGVHVPLHATLSGPEIARQLRHCQAKLLFASSAEQFAKLTAVWGELPDELSIVLYDAAAAEGNPDRRVVSLAEWMGDLPGTPEANFWPAAADRLAADGLATVIYTSGTTGRPQGVMLSQRNLVFNTLATLEAFGFQRADLRLNFLPFSHVFARTCELYTWLAAGSRLALARSRETLLADAAAVQPTVMNGVPYFFSKVCGHVVANHLQQTPGVIAGMFGGRLALCCSGGAPLGRAEFEVFAAQGIELLEGYGLTETSPVITCNRLGNAKAGTVGLALPGVEIRIADDDEILTRGEHVMRGYLHDPEATAGVIRDDWLYTGDLGTLDEQGFLTITGRKKELIVTSLGKKIVPTAIEALLCADPAIEQAMVVGDGQKVLAALIVPAPQLVGEHVGDGGPPNECDSLRDVIGQAIAARLNEVSKEAQVRSFYLCERPFAVETGELTPSLKLCRPNVMNSFAPAISSLFAEQPAE